MSSTWSRYTAQNGEQFDYLIHQSRRLIGELGVIGAGVFRERQSLTLFFSPSATADVVRVLQLPAVSCGTPDQMQVEVVAGPCDEPAWYDGTLDQFVQLMEGDYLDELDELGLAAPEEFWAARRSLGG